MSLSKVMIIRHGEKPEPGAPELGVDENGNADKNELIVRGWQRAGSLARFFLPKDGELTDSGLAKPTCLFAAAPNAAEPSKRSLHTLGPLAALGPLVIDTSCGVGEEPKLADQIRRQSGVVLVAWEHKHIKDIVGALTGGAIKSPHWPHDRFDMVFVMTPPFTSNVVQVPQMLLAGDREDPFPDKGDD
jgi:hypothetical protein